MKQTLIIFALVAVFTSPCLSDTYKCIDKQGNMHFSDTAAALPRGCNIVTDSDITVRDPDVARSVGENIQRTRKREAADQRQQIDSAKTEEAFHSSAMEECNRKYKQGQIDYDTLQNCGVEHGYNVNVEFTAPSSDRPSNQEIYRDEMLRENIRRSLHPIR
jgi:hypothetical protein